MGNKYNCITCKLRNGKRGFDFKCYTCWRKTKTIINFPYPLNSRKVESIKEAQKKVRTVRTYFQKNRISYCNRLSIPSCYMGKKVKVIVVGEENGN